MADDSAKRARIEMPPAFRATAAAAASALTDAAMLKPNGVLMPWVGCACCSLAQSCATPCHRPFYLDNHICLPHVLAVGTYKLGASSAKSATLSAMRKGYRMIDTAYIYAGEKCEPEVGKAIKAALSEGTLQSREQLFVTSKHWRKFHGYEATLGCLQRSLSRLQLEYVNLWLMHWPGPAWSTMNRRKDEIAEHGAWHYAAEGHGKDEIVALRLAIVPSEFTQWFGTDGATRRETWEEALPLMGTNVHRNALGLDVSGGMAGE